MRCALCGIFIAAICLFLPRPVQASEPLRFYGQIVDGKTGKPLPHCRVRIFDEFDIIMAGAMAAISTRQGAIRTPRKPSGYASPKVVLTCDARGRFSTTLKLRGRCEMIVDRPGTRFWTRIDNAAANKFLEIRVESGQAVPARKPFEIQVQPPASR